MQQPSTSLQTAIAEWLRHAKASDLSRVSSDGTGFRIYADMGGAIFIRPDGSMISETGSSHPDPIDAKWRTVALVASMREHPELRELLPQRPDTAVQCGPCIGTGRLLGVICGTCFGLGWKPAA
jgi:hypothetical protein